MERADVVAGARDILPALPPNITFGILFGATAVEVGFTALQATAMSLFIFAGTAQMAAVELLRADAALSVVLATVLILNLRYSIYSASLAPEVQNLSQRWRALMGYALSDINYALAVTRFGSSPEAERETDTDGEAPGGTPAVHEGWYYVGVTAPFVASFVLATLLGGLAGAAFGQALNLEFAIPLIFIALLVPMIADVTSAIIAGVSAFVAVVGVGLPFNIGLLVATGCGVAAGMFVDRLERGRSVGR